MPRHRQPSDRPPLRGWQARALDALARWDDGPFLLCAAPGAGKTRPALELARGEARRGAAVVVACPTAPLTRQWARAAHRLGLELAPDAGSPRPPRGFHGVAVTYARIARAPARWASALEPGGLVIADEAHHLGEELAWGEAFSRAFGRVARWLLLSGTPFRSDARPIPGVRYDADGLAAPDSSYGYREAVADGVCRPVVFVAYDGTLSWRSGEEVIESSFDEVLSTREAARRYRTAISAQLPDGLPRILAQADCKLREIRRDGHRDAAGLVVTADSHHARSVARLLREATGQTPVLVLHAEARSAARLHAFAGSTEPWIVAVNMVSEGVDIPRLRVGVYATAAKTPLVFRQIVGRFVRTGPGAGPGEPSWLYIPADPVLREHAATIERELRGHLRRRDDAEAMGEGDQRERARAQPSDVPEFEPLSADVAPQLTLFGGPQPPARRSRERGSFGVPSDDADRGARGHRQAPAFQRRAALREQRHRLVGELRRREGASPREINAWLNRELGISGVEQATIADLERSVSLLVRRLSARPRG
ncbi:MAG TPA: DEAD/DEAH box helicase [Solirubrobacteraceae bacterium]|nr:DEAD/DEAH box helicase [Solirubrobacteraceae bacterium]